MNTRGCVLLLSQLLCFAFSAPAQSLVRFDQARYDINPGESFQAQVLITPAPTAGLYSYGVQLALPAINAMVAALSSISVPALLDFNGVRGAGALKVLVGGLAAVKGTVDFSSSPIQPYSNSLVATFSVTDLAGGSYSLRVFNTSPFHQICHTQRGTV